MYAIAPSHYRSICRVPFSVSIPASERGTRIDWIDAAKGISILLVVFHHAHLTAASVGHGWHVFARFDALFTPVRMPLFFAVSAVFAAKAVGQSWRKLFTSKLAYFLYLYGLWTTIYWAYYRYLLPEPATGLLGTSGKQLLTMWIVPVSGQWFLWVLAIYFILAKALNNMKHPLTLAAFCALAAVAENLSRDYFAHHSHQKALLYAPFFLGGLWYGRAALSHLPQRPRAAFAIGALAYAAVAIVDEILPHDLPGTRLALSAAGLLLGCSATVLLCRSDTVRRSLSFFGRNTLSIYVAHGLVMTIAASLLSWLALPSHSPLWMTPMLGLLAGPLSLGLRKWSGEAGERWLYGIGGIRDVFRTLRDRTQPSPA